MSLAAGRGHQVPPTQKEKTHKSTDCINPKGKRGGGIFECCFSTSTITLSLRVTLVAYRPCRQLCTAQQLHCTELLIIARRCRWHSVIYF